MTKIDVSSEEYRIYTYPDGGTFRIEQPSTLFVTDTGSHRVIDEDGVTHRPTPGFVGISWKSRPGQPVFVA